MRSSDDDAAYATRAAALLRRHWPNADPAIADFARDERMIDAVAQTLRRRRRHRVLVRLMGGFVVLITAASVASVLFGE